MRSCSAFNTRQGRIRNKTEACSCDPESSPERTRRRAAALQRRRGVLLQASVAGEQLFVSEIRFSISVKSLEAPLRRDMLAVRTRHLCASSLTVCPDGLQFDSFRLYNPSSRHLIHPVDLPFRVRFSLMSTSTRSKREAAWDSTHDTEHRLRSENLAFDIGEMRTSRAHTIFLIAYQTCGTLAWHTSPPAPSSSPCARARLPQSKRALFPLRAQPHKLIVSSRGHRYHDYTWRAAAKTLSPASISAIRALAAAIDDSIRGNGWHR